MTGSEVVALIVAISGALGAIFAGIRNLRGDKIKNDVAEAATVLTGYNSLTAALQTELNRVKAEYIADRQTWIAERAEMKRELSVASERIDELGAQIYALRHQPPETTLKKGL